MPDTPEVVVCICTYKRPQLLEKLLEDLERQTFLPKRTLVVDGDPESNLVPEMLRNRASEYGLCYQYISSNHANLAYQRYLGWAYANEIKADILLYFDDDLRIPIPQTLQELIDPFLEGKGVAGVTTRIVFGNTRNLDAYPHLQERDGGRKSPGFLAAFFGSSRNLPAGGLSPTGNRMLPASNGEKYLSLSWLRGGVMGYAMKYLSQECFTEDLFAMTHIGCGLGEDTLLSHRLSFKGKLYMVNGIQVNHPHDAIPNSYPVEPFRFGFTTAYSRRLLNDYYRGFEPPHWSDRLALLKSYFGNLLLGLWKALRYPAPHRFLFTAGYFYGMIRGLVCAPRARHLTPQIRWFQDAEAALAKVNQIGAQL